MRNVPLSWWPLGRSRIETDADEYNGAAARGEEHRRLALDEVALVHPFEGIAEVHDELWRPSGRIDCASPPSSRASPSSAQTHCAIDARRYGAYCRYSVLAS